jgi:hypothetical protein
MEICPEQDVGIFAWKEARIPKTAQSQREEALWNVIVELNRAGTPSREYYPSTVTEKPGAESGDQLLRQVLQCLVQRV